MLLDDYLSYIEVSIRSRLLGREIPLVLQAVHACAEVCFNPLPAVGPGDTSCLGSMPLPISIVSIRSRLLGREIPLQLCASRHMSFAFQSAPGCWAGRYAAVAKLSVRNIDVSIRSRLLGREIRNCACSL